MKFGAINATVVVLIFLATGAPLDTQQVADTAFRPTSAPAQSASPGGQYPSRWSIYPLLTSEDPIPGMGPGARYLERIWRDPQATRLSIRIVSNGIILHSEHGIFGVTKDSIVPIITELDSIPGSSGIFADIGDYGLPRFAPQKFQPLGPRRIVFAYVHEEVLSFYDAAPGRITRIFSLPTSLTVAGRSIQTSDKSEQNNIWAWFYSEPQGRPTIYFLWATNLRDRGERPVLMFSFDGATVEKLVAEGDSVGGGTILYLSWKWGGNSRCIHESAWDTQSNRGLVTAVVEEVGERWPKDKLLLVKEHQQAISLISSGQEILNVPGGHISSVWTCNPYAWTPHFARTRVNFYGQYCLEGDQCFEGFFVATVSGIERIASWKNGDTLSAVGGKIRSFQVGRREARAFGLLNPDSQAVVSLVAISDSKGGVEEGLFSCTRGLVRKLVARKDAAPTEVGGGFEKFGQLDPLGNSGDLLFEADLEEGRADWGIFLMSDGKVSKILAQGDSVYDRRNTGAPKVFSVSDIGAKSVSAISDHSFLFWAKVSTGVQGWFLAVRE